MSLNFSTGQFGQQTFGAAGSQVAGPDGAIKLNVPTAMQGGKNKKKNKKSKKNQKGGRNQRQRQSQRQNNSQRQSQRQRQRGGK